MKTWINGKMVSKYVEDLQDNPTVARNEGQIAVQLHIGGGDKILGSGNMEYADILLEELP